MHRIGQLVVANIDAFQGMDAHTALKRIQLEGNIACEQLALTMPNVGVVMAKVPRSLSFESMDEGEYQDVARSMCRYVAERYWPDLSAEQIERMAECFVEET